MVLNLLEEQQYVLDVQAANKLFKKNSPLTLEHNQILQAGKIANKILTNENYYLILKEAKKFYPYREFLSKQVEYACWREYIHEGVLGLHEAIIRFDIFRGYRLSSFAVNWIRGSICRLSKQIINTNISYEQAKEYSFASNENNQETITISSQELELIRSFVTTLNPIDRDIINRCFGLNNYKKNSLIAIGRCNNLSPKQVARRRDRILKKLKNLLDNEENNQKN